ncbi:MAG: alpha-glucosidase [Zetaproteobacteria bacterium]|nr:alpha-glucosidase [Pseudobdellovibrionaceae bacterium]
MALDFKRSDNAFSIRLNGQIVFSHSTQHPALEIGIGQPTYKEHHSLFKITDQLSYRKKLTSWSILSDNNDTNQNKITVILEDQLTITFNYIAPHLNLEFKCTNKDWNRCWIHLPANPNEKIYGCGEQYSELNLRGKKLPLWVEEQGIGRGKDLITCLANLHNGTGGKWHTTYYAQPTFFSSANKYFHATSNSYAIFNFSHPDKHTLQLWEIPEKVTLGAGTNPLDLLSELSQLLGRQPPLPSWAYDGLWLGIQGGTDTVKRKLDDALNAGVNVAAIWAQDWEGSRKTAFGQQLMWNWQYDRKLYQNLPDTIANYRAQGIRFLGYINPMLVPEGALYNEALQKGYFVKDQNNEPMHVKITTFPSALIDFTNPAAATWYKSVIKKEMIDIGLSGWMADFGEALPINAQMHSGLSWEQAHNQYPVMWAKANREVLEESQKLGEIVFFMRAGYTGSSQYATAFWAGDQLMNWSRNDGLATVIPAAISLGFSGVGHTHSDIGGYTSVAWIKRKQELFMRWAEHSAFTPIMRTHEGNRPSNSHQFNSDSETLKHLAQCTRIYKALNPIHKSLGADYYENGIPPIRHPYLHYTNDQQLHKLKYQYMYGPDLMIANVITEKTRTKKLYLPDDEWVHLWTNKEYRQGWHKVDAPLGQPPVFFRKNSDQTKLYEEVAAAGQDTFQLTKSRL